MTDTEKLRRLLCIGMREEEDLLKPKGAVWKDGLDHIAYLDFMHLYHAAILEKYSRSCSCTCCAFCDEVAPVVPV